MSREYSELSHLYSKPLKKKSYNYTSGQDYSKLMIAPAQNTKISLQTSKPSRNYAIDKENQFSFQSKPQRKIVQVYESPVKRHQEREPTNTNAALGNNHRNLDAKISNIDTLNGKIANLLGSVNRQTNRESYTDRQLPSQTFKNISQTLTGNGSYKYSYTEDIASGLSDIGELSNKRKAVKLYSPVKREAGQTQRPKIESFLTDRNTFSPAKRERFQNKLPLENWEVDRKIVSPIKRQKHIKLQHQQRWALIDKNINFTPAQQSILSKQTLFKFAAKEQATKISSIIPKRTPEKDKETDYKQKQISSSFQLDAKIKQIHEKIIKNSPISKQISSYDPSTALINHNLPQTPISRMAQRLSQLVQIDIMVRSLRESFERVPGEQKWQRLKNDLKTRNIYMSQQSLMQVIKLSKHERNPFSKGVVQFPLNGTKDLAKLYSQAQKVWMSIQKSIDMDELAQLNFEMSTIDLARKGFISIQDMVCFINLNVQKFYRSRDLVGLFRRLLGEGKSVEQDLASGITYKELMDKICK